MKKIAPLLGLLVTTIATPALAHGTSRGNHTAWVDNLFKEADTDGNGTISKDEWADHAEKKFDKMDTNNDGELSKSEVMAFEKSHMKSYRHKRSMKHTSMNSPHNSSNDQDRVDTSNDAKSNAPEGSDTGE